MFFHNLFDLKAQIGYNFYRLHADNGLAQNSVWEVFQDYKGFLWIGTADGLNRWDGVNMVHYYYNPKDSYSIKGNSSFSFYEDIKNQLWVFHNKGVSLYDRTHDRFISIISTNIYHFFLGHYKNMLIVSDEKSNIFLIDIFNFQVYPYHLLLCNTISFNDKFYDKAIQFDNWIIYISSSNNIIKYNLFSHAGECIVSNNSFSLVNKLTDTSCVTFSKDSAFLFTFHKSTNRVIKTTYPLNNIFKNNLPTSTALYDNKIWVGGEFGIYLLHPQSFQVIKYIPKVSLFASKNEFIYGFYIDRSKNFYILTNLNGLYIISPSGNRFKHFKTPFPEFNMVKSITKTNDGKIITGQYRASLAIYHSNDSIMIKNFFNNENENTVYGLKNIDNCNLLVVTANRILTYDHCKDKIEKSWQFSKNPINVYPYIQFRNNSYELNIVNGQGSSIVTINSNFIIDTICFFPNETVTAYYSVNDSLYLIGTRYELFTYNRFTYKRSNPIIKTWIKSIIASSHPYYILATINGIFLLNKEFAIIYHLGVHNGLPDGFIYGILQDKKGNYWFSHNKGLSCFDTSLKYLTHFNIQDGLQSNEFNTGAFYQHDDGKLYFGGVNGVNEIDPDNIFKNKIIPQIAISQIWVDDEPFHTDSSVNEVTTLVLPYSKNTFSVDFSALDFSIPEKNSYAYYLKGIDKDWIEAGNRHFLRYANLSPGHYTLVLKAANSDGIWSDPRILNIIVKPPFWMRTWFYFLEGITVLLIIILIILFVRRNHHLAIRRELETQQKIEKERIRISRDLHDHVGAQLTYLISQLDSLADNPNQLQDPNAWNKKILFMSETGRNTMLALRETIWAVSHQQLTIEEFVDRYKQYVLKMASMDQQLQVQFHEDIPEYILISPTNALHLFRICQEAFHNALKYSKAPNIDIYFQIIDSKFICKISDNGIGFNIHQPQRTNSYGLQNMKQRAEEIGALFSIESIVGKGTSITLSLSIST